MELAAYGTEQLHASGRIAAAPDRHRDEIAQRLADTGLIVETGVGLSDFRVDISLADPTQPDRPRVAVLLDGPGWASRRTVGDRDGLPVDVLAKLMHWPAVERVWMPTWVANADAVVAHLVEVTAKATQPALPQPTAATSPSLPPPSLSSDAPQSTAPVVTAPLRGPTTPPLALPG